MNVRSLSCLVFVLLGITLACDQATPGTGTGTTGTITGNGGSQMPTGGGAGTPSGGSGTSGGAANSGGNDSAGGSENNGGSGNSGGAGGSGNAGGAEAQSFYPLVDGATWTYEHLGINPRVEIEAQVACSADPDRCDVTGYDAASDGFWQGPSSAADNVADDQNETSGIIVKDGTTVTRVWKREYDMADMPFEVTYVPGFPRFDAAWETATEGQEFSYNYVRTRVDDPTMPEDRNQVFVVESLSDTITVGAGTFECIRVKRRRVETDSAGNPVVPTDDDQATEKLFWYAKGIGKVKEEHLDGRTAGKTEELVRCTLCPGGT